MILFCEVKIMKTYLVTGGAGFIGSNFIKYILREHEDIRVINFDKLTYAGNLENLKGVEHDDRYSFIKGDICDSSVVSKILKDYDIDFIVNFAAETHVDRSIEGPGVFVSTNIQGTLNLLNCAREAWMLGEGYIEGKRFLQVSTDEVYGALGNEGFFTEDTPLNPHSPYSASKAGADMMVMAFHDTHGMPVNITRCSNNYGPNQFPEKLIPLVINNSLNKRDIPVYGDGLNVRDWLYVDDHCSALDSVLHKGVIGQVYNIGGHNERTNIHIVKTIISYLNEKADEDINESLIKYVQDRKGHDRRYGIDPEKIGRELGWQPVTCFEDGIKITIDWYLKNAEWLKGVTSGDYQSYYERMYSSR